jgi:hypothetical protein
LLDEYPKGAIFVEEQDSKYYILHIEAEAKQFDRWIIVVPGTPLYEDLRGFHIQWLKGKL